MEVAKTTGNTMEETRKSALGKARANNKMTDLSKPKSGITFAGSLYDILHPTSGNGIPNPPSSVNTVKDNNTETTSNRSPSRSWLIDRLYADSLSLPPETYDKQPQIVVTTPPPRPSVTYNEPRFSGSATPPPWSYLSFRWF